MEEKLETVEQGGMEQSKGSGRTTYEELKSKCKAERKEAKTPSVDIKDLGKKCEIVFSEEYQSKFEDGKPTYDAAKLKMEDGTFRFKALSTWDKEAIEKSKSNRFVIGSITHKGSIKLCLKAESTDGLVAGI